MSLGDWQMQQEIEAEMKRAAVKAEAKSLSGDDRKVQVNENGLVTSKALLHNPQSLVAVTHENKNTYEVQVKGQGVSLITGVPKVRDWFSSERNPFNINLEGLLTGVYNRLEEISVVVDIDVREHGKLTAQYCGLDIAHISNAALSPFGDKWGILDQCRTELLIGLAKTLTNANNWYGKPILFRMFFGHQNDYFATDLGFYERYYATVGFEQTEDKRIITNTCSWIDNNFAGHLHSPYYLENKIDFVEIARYASNDYKFPLFMPESFEVGKQMVDFIRNSFDTLLNKLRYSGYVLDAEIVGKDGVGNHVIYYLDGKVGHKPFSNLQWTGEHNKLLGMCYLTKAGTYLFKIKHGNEFMYAAHTIECADGFTTDANGDNHLHDEQRSESKYRQKALEAVEELLSDYRRHGAAYGGSKSMDALNGLFEAAKFILR